MSARRIIVWQLLWFFKCQNCPMPNEQYWGSK